MNHVLIACSLLTCSIILSGCGNAHHDNSLEVETQSHEDRRSHPQVGTKNTLDGMSLNDGKKWAMDKHTRSSFATMTASFLSNDLPSMSPESLKELGVSLQQSNTILIQGCTMTGAAHDQLHVFLTKYIAAVDSLAETGDMDDANTIKLYLEGYDEYFE